MFEPLHSLISAIVDLARLPIQPEARIFWLYLVSSATIVGLTVLCKRQSAQPLAHKLKPALWWNDSSKVDLQWLLTNHFIQALLIIPLLGSQLTWAIMLNRQLYQYLGEGNFWQVSSSTSAMLFTVVLFLCEDFSRFFVHRLQHKLPCLWRFHAVHHSATTLTPLTLYRIHSIELLINACRSVVVAGTVSGLFLYCFAGSLSLIEILGVNIFMLAFNIAGANLRHSPFYIGFGRAEHLFISPAQHQVHHSLKQQHYDKNFGSCLALWDKLFNSWLASNTQEVHEFGLKGNTQLTFWQQVTGIHTKSVTLSAPNITEHNQRRDRPNT